MLVRFMPRLMIASLEDNAEHGVITHPECEEEAVFKTEITE
jgi:hypothetical protein